MDRATDCVSDFAIDFTKKLASDCTIYSVAYFTLDLTKDFTMDYTTSLEK